MSTCMSANPKTVIHEYDVFLCHSSADSGAIESIAVRLREAGLRPFFGAWHIVPGEPWMPALERAIATSKTVAVFFGEHGITGWHAEEARLVFTLDAAEESRVIPVLLLGGSKVGIDLPQPWIDLAAPFGIAALVAAIRMGSTR